MSLTRSPCCHHLCFSNAAMCPWCGQAFESGALERPGKALGSINSPLKADIKI
jgi:hypothetical protein